MILLYNIAIRFYYSIIYIASLWNEKARKWVAGRKNISADLSKKKSNNQTIWFHCASVGEYEQALPLIRLCKQKYGGFQVLVTFYSPSGYEYARKKFPDEWIVYLPLDTRHNISSFIHQVNPVFVFVIKYEFWYHMLSQLHDKNIPVFLVSGIFRKEQLFFSPFGTFQRKILHFFTHLYVQNEDSRALLKSIHIGNVTVTGDTRFDRVNENKNEIFHDLKIARFVTTEKIFVAGSVWDSDIPVLKKIIDILPSDWKIMLVPHEINHFSTDWIIEPFIKYTDPEIGDSRILFIDTMGILSKLYRYAKFVYVGGGFGKGIHNILEPAVYCKPVFIGTRFHKFNEAAELVRLECAFSVNSENAGDFIKREIFDENKYQLTEDRLNRYMSVNTNLSEKILVYVDRYLNC